MLSQPCKSIVDLVQFFKDNQVVKVLDYGAGKLRNSIYLLNKGFKVYACDTEKQIRKINSLMEVNEFPYLINESQLMSHRLNVDLVVSNYVLNIIEDDSDKLKYIKNTYNSLKKRGYLLLEVRRRTERTPRDCTKAFTKKELNNFILNCNFEKLKDYSSKRSVVFLYQKTGL
jgi:SAM-dependent methyltransferase